MLGIRKVSHGMSRESSLGAHGVLTRSVYSPRAPRIWSWTRIKEREHLLLHRALDTLSRLVVARE
jgi:hypothetical protein